MKREMLMGGAELGGGSAFVAWLDISCDMRATFRTAHDLVEGTSRHYFASNSGGAGHAYFCRTNRASHASFSRLWRPSCTPFENLPLRIEAALTEFFL